MKKSVFRRLFLLYAAIMIIALLVSGILVTSTVKENHLEDLKQNLSVEIDLISDAIPFSSKNLDNLCTRLKNKTGARVTIITDSGRVIGDSDTPSSDMEDHLQRTEIAQARHFGSGSMIRRSETLKIDFLYFAKFIKSESGREGYIRLSVPLSKIDHAMNRLRIEISIIFAVALIAMWLIALWQTNHLRKLVGQIKDFSASLARGDIDKRIFIKTGNEFGEIAANLLAMAGKLHGLLLQSEKERSRLNVILKSIPDALLIMDRKGHIQLSNAAAATFFGDLHVTGKHYMEVVRSNAFTELIENVRKDLAEGTAAFTLDTPAKRHFSVLVAPLFYKEQELAGFVAVFHDITRLERLERVRRDFVANISHEIKTPITAIKGFAETLLEGAIDERDNAVKFLDTIRQNSERINNLVDDLLTLSKIELGVFTIEKKQLAVKDIVEQISSMLQPKAAAKGLGFHAVIDPEFHEVLADRDRLIQIFTNLVDNAIKFTESGSVTFGTGIADSKSYIFVEDTGIGVPASQISRLGERFYRVDTARSRKMGGTGLGLAIVKHLVKAHGWDMHIESYPGKGTTVKLFV
jgi:two-component system, OmpR family, phosphate regulon sensor histidine kinase PhoR